MKSCAARWPRGQLRIEGGRALAPDEPGLGIAWDRDAIEDRRVR
jgi:L-alanine-DL-glutamate epimerase-like enolase superfamily enzyme